MEPQPTKAAILAALSRALDLVEGQPEGHAIRTCLLAMRVGREFRMNELELGSLYFAALLKDTGCSNNSVRIYKTFGGDDLLTKQRVKLIDWTSAYESVRFAMSETERGRSLGAKLRRMASNLGPPKRVMQEVTEARCTRGALIAQKLGFGKDVSDAILHLDEHWDGEGSPRGVDGRFIPLTARILCAAQTFDVFESAFGLDEAYDMLATRSGRWFDPAVVEAFKSFRGEASFWVQFGADDAETEALRVELPVVAEAADAVDIDQICEAFAMIVDAKSSFTWEHSSRVTANALTLADWFGLDEERVASLRRAAMMHDIGKLGIATSILEKPAQLTLEEVAKIRSHPRLSFEILQRVPGFTRIAEIASAHHERLDGNGYWRGLGADQLDLDVRILTTADVFDALSSKRPYKDPLPMSQVFGIMEKDAGVALDADCVAALKEHHVGDSQLAA